MTQSTATSATLSTLGEDHLIRSVRSLYQTDHQEEFLHLQAQIESLLAQLNALKLDRQSVVPAASETAIAAE